ncbi:hypothetical protein B0H10DRAFT_2229081 [Mycena sp. CBHHK59/15]|nr:hypothetical protein B0H10DRAFT_2229081 [Mycena sp. CBHHK59/15]
MLKMTSRRNRLSMLPVKVREAPADTDPRNRPTPARIRRSSHFCESPTGGSHGSKKGRILLGRKRPWLILPSCWAHQFQLILGDSFKVHGMAAEIAEDATALIAWINNHGKVHKIFDKAQAVVSKKYIPNPTPRHSVSNISKSDTSGQMGRASQQTRHNFRKSDTHNQLVSLAYARLNGMAPCQIFTSLSLPHHHYPAIAPASPRSNMLARRSPDGRKPDRTALWQPRSVVPSPLQVKTGLLGQGSPRRLNRVQERHTARVPSRY